MPLYFYQNLLSHLKKIYTNWEKVFEKFYCNTNFNVHCTYVCVHVHVQKTLNLPADCEAACADVWRTPRDWSRHDAEAHWSIHPSWRHWRHRSTEAAETRLWNRYIKNKETCQIHEDFSKCYKSFGINMTTVPRWKASSVVSLAIDLYMLSTRNAWNRKHATWSSPPLDIHSKITSARHQTFVDYRWRLAAALKWRQQRAHLLHTLSADFIQPHHVQGNILGVKQNYTTCTW